MVCAYGEDIRQVTVEGLDRARSLLELDVNYNSAVGGSFATTSAAGRSSDAGAFRIFRHAVR